MKTLRGLIEKRKENKNSVLIDEKTILFVFTKIIRREFGEVGGIKIKPKRFLKNKIITSLESSNWAAELFIRKKYICSEVNKSVGQEIVFDIIIENS